uniref:SFRICE_005533 n=1 Tax=Spodoptera frugiperda TaxID=7108 RepID=A0A2H1VS72_SPOFR
MIQNMRIGGGASQYPPPQHRRAAIAILLAATQKKIKKPENVKTKVIPVECAAKEFSLIFCRRFRGTICRSNLSRRNNKNNIPEKIPQIAIRHHRDDAQNRHAEDLTGCRGSGSKSSSRNKDDNSRIRFCIEYKSRYMNNNLSEVLIKKVWMNEILLVSTSMTWVAIDRVDKKEHLKTYKMFLGQNFSSFHYLQLGYDWSLYIDCLVLQVVTSATVGSSTESRVVLSENNCRKNSVEKEDWRDAGGGAPVRSRHAMGSNISQHSAKGLKGRRARSSGDLCNGDTKSQTESSVCGSVVGDVMGWNRSLPNHLDGNRHLADYSRVNNNYGEFGTYNRCHPKGGRGLRYRVSKSVWYRRSDMFSAHDSQERRKSMKMEDNADTTSEIIFAEKLYFSMYRIKDKYTNARTDLHGFAFVEKVSGSVRFIEKKIQEKIKRKAGKIIGGETEFAEFASAI